MNTLPLKLVFARTYGRAEAWSRWKLTWIKSQLLRFATYSEQADIMTSMRREGQWRGRQSWLWDGHAVARAAYGDTSRAMMFDYVLCIQLHNAQGKLYCQGGLQQGLPPNKLHRPEGPIQSWTNWPAKNKNPHNTFRPRGIATLFQDASALNEMWDSLANEEDIHGAQIEFVEVR